MEHPKREYVVEEAGPSWWRSEDMTYVHMIVNEDAAHASVTELGRLGIIEFTDLNEGQTAFQRRYTAHLRLCDEVERSIRFFREQVERFGLPVAPRSAPPR